MPANQSLRDWFFFTDRQTYSPVQATSITTHALIDRRSGSIDEIGSMREEWLIRSAFVDADKLDDVHHPADPHAFDFSPSWDGGLTFHFADRFKIREADAYPLIITRTHPISDKLEVELRPDFRWYHFLPAAGEEYRHPLDDIVVASVRVETHDFYNPTPRVSLHPDYLRDYLAARKFALVIAVAADRFATRATEAELEITTTKEPMRIDDVTAIWPITHPDKQSPFGRSSLYWSIVVHPYPRPRPERSAWHYFGDLPDDGSVSPTFVLDAEGHRGTAKDAGLTYLYFKREVLRKYLDSAGYSVYFHMRNWGSASTPKNLSVDVGVNEAGLVTAFAPDIADLPNHDQAYWASFSVLPSGGVCRELYETRMMLRPPHSPSIPEIITGSVSALNEAFKARYGLSLYRARDPLPSRRHLSVGPVTEKVEEFLDLTKILYAVTVEDIAEKALKEALPVDLQPKKEENIRSIGLLERLLIAADHPESDVRAVTSKLRALRNLRVVEAHLLSANDVLNEFKIWGVAELPRSVRSMWHVAVDSIASALHELASLIGPTRTE